MDMYAQMKKWLQPMIKNINKILYRGGDSSDSSMNWKPKAMRAEAFLITKTRLNKPHIVFTSYEELRVVQV